LTAIYPRFTHESGTIRKKQAIEVSKLKRLVCYESQHQSQSNEKSLVQFDYEKAVSSYLGTQSTFNPLAVLFVCVCVCRFVLLVSRMSSHCVCARVPFAYKPSVNACDLFSFDTKQQWKIRRGAALIRNVKNAPASVPAAQRRIVKGRAIAIVLTAKVLSRLAFTRYWHHQ